MIGAAVLGVFLVGHGLTHASYLARPPAPKAGAPAWPFDLRRSRLLEAVGLRAAPPRPLAAGLVAVTVGAYARAGAAALGLVPPEVWTAAVATGSLASLTVLGLWFHPWLALGVAIDLVLLYAALIAGWTPATIAL